MRKEAKETIRKTSSLFHDLAGGLALVAVAGGMALAVSAMPCRAGSGSHGGKSAGYDHRQIEKRADSDLKESIDEAVKIVNALKATSTKKGIPQRVINEAKGIAILKVTKAGIVVSGSGGEGVLITKTKRGWSAPLAIEAGDFGVGAQLGVKISKMVLVLNTDKAVQAFAQNSSLGIGASASATAGPSNADVDAYSNVPGADIYVYQETNGAFVGAAIEGSLLDTDKDANREFYGKGVTTDDIIAGRIPAPPEAARIYQGLGIRPVS